ncbi:General stress protein A [Candidatus Hartigia pinicola]|nr:General stress protein A [Candidatus Hartigia pinicola]
MSRIDIAYCSDNNYVEYLSVSLMSVLLNNLKNTIYFHIFLFKISKENLEKLKKIDANILFYHINDDVMKKYNRNYIIKHLNMSTYIKLIVPRMLYGRVEKIIYLDIDTLCFSDLSEIDNINIVHYICAVSSDTKNNIDTKNTARLGLKRKFYFNAGVLYINIKNWIDFDVENKINNLISHSWESLTYYEQDALNKILEDNIIIMNNSWNYLYTWMNFHEKENYFYSKLSIPKIIHFTGSRKPWYKEHKCLSQNLFIFYKHFTPWNNTKLRSYTPKVKNSDNRVYCREECYNKNYLLALKFYLKYLKTKLKL